MHTLNSSVQSVINCTLILWMAIVCVCVYIFLLVNAQQISKYTYTNHACFSCFSCPHGVCSRLLIDFSSIHKLQGYKLLPYSIPARMLSTQGRIKGWTQNKQKILKATVETVPINYYKTKFKTHLLLLYSCTQPDLMALYERILRTTQKGQKARSANYCLLCTH